MPSRITGGAGPSVRPSWASSVFQAGSSANASARPSAMKSILPLRSGSRAAHSLRGSMTTS